MNLRAIIALASAALLTMVFALVSSAGPPPCIGDADSDGVCDDIDNCLGIANPTQHDPDTDGYGTACDYDIDNNCVTGTNDAVATLSNGLLAAPWSPPEAGAMDIDQNGVIGTNDAVAVLSNGLSNPGPSGRSCAACTGAVPGACPNL